MKMRERIQTVYRGEAPDVVPFMLDLSHWFYHRNGMPWDLSKAYEQPETELIEYHKRMGVGFYLPNLASFYSGNWADDVKGTTAKRMGGDAPEIAWRLETPLGAIERTRRWDDRTYAWGIGKWGVRTEEDLRVFAYAMRSRTFSPHWDRYQAWIEEVGDDGVVYMPVGYSAMGHLLNLWMGVEETVFAAVDCPAVLRETVDAVNDNILQLVDLVATSPAEVILMGDNFSSDIQPPSFFKRWSLSFYEEAIRRLHAAGKFVAVHIDGRLKGAISMIRDVGADCADAVTPAPMGDLTPEECREEAGPDFLLSGGVAPDLWLPHVPVDTFKAKVLDWIRLKKRSLRLIANVGDQVPPGAEQQRIEIMRDLVEEHGRN